jgi:hypothetical protein
MRSLFFAALLAAGCTSGKGDSLVVVTVDAVPALTNVALLHTESTVGTAKTTRDVGADKAPFSIGGGAPKTDFAVQVASSLMGTFTIHVEARDSAGNVMAQGDGMTTLAPGKRKDIAITLGAQMVPDGGTDAMPVVVAQPEPIWIGSGGSSTRLNLNAGGFDTVGATAAPSGARLAGPFATQTY